MVISEKKNLLFLTELHVEHELEFRLFSTLVSLANR